MPKQVFPEPVVGALIANPKGKFFLMKSHKWNNSFVLPGGHIELGETMEQAVKREVKEETGLDVFDVHFFCMHEIIFNKDYFKKKHFLSFHFTCKTISEKVRLNPEAEEYTWATIAEAMRLPMQEHTKKTIEEYKKKIEEIKK